MPPKAKITKDEILTKAFSILKQEGFTAVTTRRLSKELNCSTQPIYYIFQDKEELKKCLYEKARSYFQQIIQSMVSESKEEEFLAMGVAYVKAAKQERHIFHFICMENNYSMDGVQELVSGAKLPDPNARLFLNLWLYAHGIACIVANNDVAVNESEIRNLLYDAYLGFRNGGDHEK